ncbi:MAG: cytochrome c oxidase subunit 3 [Acidobacteriota bacterium]|nr:cytochrome c oxidase subunit 3 [Acidobacteriota bacterium]
MAGSLTRDAVSRPPLPPDVEGGWGDGGGNYEGRGSSRGAAFTGIYVLLAASGMMFAAFSSAMVVRRGLGDDWVSLHKPPVLWLNTAILLLSSVVLEKARRALRAHNRDAFTSWWTAGTLLGALFLGGQTLAWLQLRAAHVYAATNPSGAFFYILTAAHAVHLVAGVCALLYVDVQAFRLRLGPAKRTTIDVSTIFWHFLDGLWLYLMLLFYVWG